MPFPSKYISLRGDQEEKYTLLHIGRFDKLDGAPKVLEEIEVSRALFEAYEGAVV
jgi:DEAD/DEAH box helicase domain-containing protein